MKKFGFTLAEILVTLGIVGVVSALTIPVLTTNARNEANASKLASTVSTLENAFGMVVMNNDGSDLNDIDFNSSVQSYLTEVLKLQRFTTSSTDIYPSSTSFKTLSGGTGTMQGDYFCQLKDGSVMSYKKNVKEGSGTPSASTAFIYVDVNGGLTPNRYGRDIFAFVLGSDGVLYPFGSDEAAAFIDNDDKTCSSSSGSGLGCTNRLIQNNYKLDY